MVQVRSDLCVGVAVERRERFHPGHTPPLPFVSLSIFNNMALCRRLLRLSAHRLLWTGVMPGDPQRVVLLL